MVLVIIIFYSQHKFEIKFPFRVHPNFYTIQLIAQRFPNEYSVYTAVNAMAIQ